MHSTRRDILKLGATAAAAALAAPLSRGTAFAAYKKVPIGTQLWCVRRELATDIPGTLKAIGEMGFDGVELENAFGKTGKEWRTHLDAAKLKACGFHHTLAELQGDKLAQSVEFNQAIGNDKLIIRSFPKEVYTSADELKKVIEAVNAAAEKARAMKMRVGYHNHTTDFNRINGEYWWNLFADGTPKDFILQFDTGNASEMEGVPIVELIKRNAGRTASMHVKPHSKKNPKAYIGSDELDWPAIMTASETAGGIEWYIIEYEVPGTPPREAIKANLDLFKKIRA